MKNTVKQIGIVILIVAICGIFNVSCEIPDDTADYAGIYSGNINYDENKNDGATVTNNKITGNSIVNGSIITISNVSVGQYYQIIGASVPNPPKFAFVYSGNTKIGYLTYYANLNSHYFHFGKERAEKFKKDYGLSINISDMDDSYDGYLWGRQ